MKHNTSEGMGDLKNTDKQGIQVGPEEKNLLNGGSDQENGQESQQY